MFRQGRRALPSGPLPAGASPLTGSIIRSSLILFLVFFSLVLSARSSGLSCPPSCSPFLWPRWAGRRPEGRTESRHIVSRCGRVCEPRQSNAAGLLRASGRLCIACRKANGVADSRTGRTDAGGRWMRVMPDVPMPVPFALFYFSDVSLFVVSLCPLPLTRSSSFSVYYFFSGFNFVMVFRFPLFCHFFIWHFFCSLFAIFLSPSACRHLSGIPGTALLNFRIIT